MRPLGQNYMQGVTKVSDLMTEDGTSWDNEKIDGMFTPTDACDIKNIVIGGPGCRDYLAWNHTKSGQFSVRSAYHLRTALSRTKTG